MWIQIRNTMAIADWTIFVHIAAIWLIQKTVCRLDVFLMNLIHKICLLCLVVTSVIMISQKMKNMFLALLIAWKPMKLFRIEFKGWKHAKLFCTLQNYKKELLHKKEILEVWHFTISKKIDLIRLYVSLPLAIWLLRTTHYHGIANIRFLCGCFQ